MLHWTLVLPLASGQLRRPVSCSGRRKHGRKYATLRLLSRRVVGTPDGHQTCGAEGEYAGGNPVSDLPRGHPQ
jgi:hypothetical protein